MALKDHIHIVPRFGDVLITIGFIKWGGWEHLRRSVFDRNIRIWSFVFAVIGSLLAVITEVFAYPLRIIFRVRPGKLGAGIFITLLAAWNIVLFNNEPTLSGYWTYISQSLKILYTFIFTNSYSDLHWQEIVKALWKPQSPALKIFFYVYATSAVLQLFGFYFLNWRNGNPWSKGVSWLYLILKKHCWLSQYYFEVLYEPALAIMLGWLFNHYYGDTHFAFFLWISAGALFIQEAMDYLMKMTFEK